VMTVSEDPQPSATPDTPAVPDVIPDVVVPDVIPDVVVPDVSPDVVQDVSPTQGTRLTDIVVGRVTDQARRTAKAARAGRVANVGGEPGVLDLTPLRELIPELTEELRKVRPRERIARALRQAADIIDPQTPVR
jgi:hypothetical protein